MLFFIKLGHLIQSPSNSSFSLYLPALEKKKITKTPYKGGKRKPRVHVYVCKIKGYRGIWPQATAQRMLFLQFTELKLKQFYRLQLSYRAFTVYRAIVCKNGSFSTFGAGFHNFAWLIDIIMCHGSMNWSIIYKYWLP